MEVTQIFFKFFNIFQSDVVHQSVFELVHSEDREELQRQLVWNSFLTPDQAAIPLQVVQKISGHRQKNISSLATLTISVTGYLAWHHTTDHYFLFSGPSINQPGSGNFHSKTLSNEQ